MAPPLPKLKPPHLTRPEGSAPQDFHLSRRGIAGLMFTGYAAYALSAEAEPIHTDDVGLVTENLTIAEGADSLPAYVARPAAKGRYPAIIVVSEVFGVHEYIRDVCRRLAKLGYVAVAPAFFFRADPNNTLAQTSDFTVIQKIVATAHNEQVMGDVGATLAWLQQQPFVDKKRLAVTGFCWGGAVVWMSVDRYPALKAGVAWYGRLSPPAPGTFMSDDDRKWPLQLTSELHTPVLGLYGGLDKGIPPADIEAMRAQLKAAGQTEDQLIVYPDAQHGFHADYRSSYNKAAAEDGWARMLAFFKAEHMEPGARHGVFG
jgi:carboxymethylenebutenolidase